MHREGQKITTSSKCYTEDKELRLDEEKTDARIQVPENRNRIFERERERDRELTLRRQA
jgi:hypothetical protein